MARHEPSSVFNGMPADIGAAMSVLSGLFGGHTQARAAMAGTAWPSGMPMPMSGAGAIPTGGVGRALRAGASAIPRGAVRIGGGILTANAVMQEIQRSAERAQVESAMARFHLDKGDAAQLLSARAYVWAVYWTPVLFWSVPFSGPVNERVAEAVGRFERDNPGTLGLACAGSASAQQAITAVVRTAVASGGAIFSPPVFEYRASKVNSALSASSTRARAAAQIQKGNRSWIAHHLLTFAGVARLPMATQQAIAASGWRMDSPENVIALPANFAAYLAQAPLLRLPLHRGSHRRYSAKVDLALASVATTNATGPQLRSLLLAQENQLRLHLFSIAGEIPLQ